MDRVHDLAARGDHLLDTVAGLEFEVLHHRELQRVGHGDGELVLLEAHGHAVPLEGHVLRDQDHGHRVRRVVDQVDDGEPCGKCDACLSVAAGTSLDVIEIDAAVTRFGTTSFTIGFALRRPGEEPIVTAECVYVVVDKETWTKRPLTAVERELLTEGGRG